ncbi:MAG: LON peptidase substrate-binding domain-containing protein [Planctomycetales bacterium]|nr:LON peptidase substrate-binding domain-containing protein [Planctomycetales bacterium]
MSVIVEFTDFPEKFAGWVPLFPLPNLVMFPHVIQPLRIFEPRYRQMLEAALESDRLLAMGLLASGWENDYDGQPPIHPVVCVGHVMTSMRMEDGQYNIMLQGIRRGLLKGELPPNDERLFRTVEIELIDDYYPPDGTPQRSELHDKLMESFRSALSNAPAVQEQMQDLLSLELTLGILTDLVAFTMNIDLELKQQLLSQHNVDRRAMLLIERLHRREEKSADRSSPPGGFPPPFSLN